VQLRIERLLAPKPTSGQEEAKQEALSKEQFSHMRGGKVADSLEEQKRKEQAKR